MKLIDFLVKELPKHGGWPEEALVAKSYSHLPDVHFWNAKMERVPSRSLTIDILGDDAATCEKYEAALAASKQTEWDGEGLPPVGCECEAFDGVSWFPVVIVGRYDGFAFAWNYDHRKTLTVNEVHSVNFRPIRTETERKRELTIRALQEWMGQGYSATQIYDLAIAKGEIPGIRLTDDPGN